jgi:hypothetical protein
MRASKCCRSVCELRTYFTPFRIAASHNCLMTPVSEFIGDDNFEDRPVSRDKLLELSSIDLTAEPVSVVTINIPIG